MNLALLALLAFVPQDAWYDEFQPLHAVQTQLDAIAAGYEAATTLDVGTSIEGRTIRGLRITTAPADTDPPTVLVLGTQHAREWLSPMVTTCIAEHLAAGDAGVDVLERLQFIFVPVVNPDGYVYSWDTDRFWRSNRRPGGGVDLNRNWATMWGLGTGGAGTETYPGTAAFSEPETAAILDLANAHDVVVFVDYHSPVNLVLIPFAFTSDPGPREEEQLEWGEAVSTAIESVNGLPHDVRKPGQGMPSGGLAQDWFADDQGALAFTIELRGGGGSGFDPPADLIVPTCAENWAGFLELAQRTSDAYGVDPPKGTTGGRDDTGGDVPTTTGVGQTSGSPGTTGLGGSTSTGGTSSVDADTSANATAETGDTDPPAAGGDAKGCGCRSRPKDVALDGLWVLLAFAGVCRRRRGVRVSTSSAQAS